MLYIREFKHKLYKIYKAYYCLKHFKLVECFGCGDLAYLWLALKTQIFLKKNYCSLTSLNAGQFCKNS